MVKNLVIVVLCAAVVTGGVTLFFSEAAESHGGGLDRCGGHAGSRPYHVHNYTRYRSAGCPGYTGSTRVTPTPTPSPRPSTRTTDVSSNVASNSCTVDVTVWKNVRTGGVYLSTRAPGERWDTHDTPIDLSRLSSSGAFYQGSPISIEVTCP